MKKYLKVFLAFLLGTGIGLLLFFVFTIAPIPVSSPLLSSIGIHKPRIVGFLPYFLLFRATSDYNPYINTLTYFGLTIAADGHIQKLATPTQEEPGWHNLQTQKVQEKLINAKNHGVVLSLAVVQQDEATIAAILTEPKTHADNLLQDIIPLMKNYGFTDLNIDIEGFKKVDASTQQQFTTFMQNLKQGLEKQHDTTLTIDIAPIALINSTVINPLQVGQVADYMLVMGYDLHTVLSPNTGPVAPLGGAGIESELDVKKAIHIAIEEIEPQKIILGVPLYGYEWDSLSSTPGAATIPNTGQTASNKRITDTFTTSCTTCITKEDTLAQESIYISQEKQGDRYFHQAFVPDKKFLTRRIDFAKQNHLAGVGLWALGYESSTMLEPLSLYKTFTFQ